MELGTASQILKRKTLMAMILTVRCWVRNRWLFIFTQRQYTGMYRASVQFSRSIRRFQRFGWEVIGISSDT
jgi:hypothetical protein